MSKHKYSISTEKENMAKAVGLSLEVSTKHAIELCNFLRKKKVVRALNILDNVIAKKEAVPYKRFNSDIGHKPGKVGPGRYPVKCAKAIKALIENAVANAVNKNLDKDNLVITHIVANRAAGTMRYGRQRGRSAKRSHVEVVVEGAVVEKKKEAPAKPKKESAPKPAEKVKKTEAPKPKEEKKPQAEKKPVAKPAEKEPAKKQEEKSQSSKD